MPQLLDLPRELRDMIWMASITTERPPSYRPYSRYTTYRGTSFLSTHETPPTTCANLLACNRQIYSEMNEAIQRAKEKGLASVKLDCIPGSNGGPCHITWLRIPIVKTVEMPQAGPKASTGWRAWACYLSNGYQQWLYRVTGRGAIAYRRKSSTLIHQLWMDIRSEDDKLFSSPWDRHILLMGVFESLKYVVEAGPDFTRQASWSSTLTKPRTTFIDELVLNIVNNPTMGGGNDHAGVIEGEDELIIDDERLRSTANQLVGMWNQLWLGPIAGEDYDIFLKRINRVRVCVDGHTWRARDLALELERGRAERRRIAGRELFTT